jgi:branched-chain amino acid transport system permease protein
MRQYRDGLILAAMLVALALLPLVGPPSWVLGVMARLMIFMLAASALDLVLGIGGLVSFGHAAFIGIGAYASGILLTEGVNGLSSSLVAGAAAAGLYALLTGAVAIRTSGISFIMITLAFGQMAFFVANALSDYGGSDGLTLWSRATVNGTKALKNETHFYLLTLAVLTGGLIVLRVLAASPFGRVLHAARDNPERVLALGFNINRVRLVAYVISAMLCGLSGVLLANLTTFVSPAIMAWQRSGELIVMVILGGAGTVWGAAAGAIVVLLLEEGLSLLSEHWKLGFGLILVLAVLYTRSGLAGLVAGGRRG